MQAAEGRRGPVVALPLRRRDLAPTPPGHPAQDTGDHPDPHSCHRSPSPSPSHPSQPGGAANDTAEVLGSAADGGVQGSVWAVQDDEQPAAGGRDAEQRLFHLGEAPFHFILWYT